MQPSHVQITLTLNHAHSVRHYKVSTWSSSPFSQRLAANKVVSYQKKVVVDFISDIKYNGVQKEGFLTELAQTCAKDRPYSCRW